MIIRKKKLGAFKDELIALYRKHGVSIGHEDSHGAFIIRNFRESDARWIKDATNDATDPLEHAGWCAAWKDGAFGPKLDDSLCDCKGDE